MLQAFVFEKVGVVVGDLYFLDPNPHPGQEGPEHGVRLELRVIDRGELKSSIYSAVPIAVGQPVWRVLGLRRAGPPTSWTVWLGDPDEMARLIDMGVEIEKT